MEQNIRNNYIEEVKQIKEAIAVSRYRAARHVNAEILGLYYSVGKFISLHTRGAQWGTGALRSISNQLQQELPGLKGFSEGNMRKMRLFYEAWQPVFEPQNEVSIVPISNQIELFDFRSQVANIMDNENRSALPNETPSTDNESTTIRSQVANELTNEFILEFLNAGFDNHNTIITKAESLDEQMFYVLRCGQLFWGRETLRNALRNDLYHKQGTMPSNFAVAIPDDKQRAVAMQTFKEDNVLDFLHIENPDLVDEQDVEQQIVDNIRNFLLSLGSDFAFMGNQYRLMVNGRERMLDLLFYHRRMRCLVAIELKAGRFEPEYIGKLNYYLSALDSYVKLPDENPSIGILLCRDKDNTEVEFALRDISKPMGVATYHSIEELPESYRALPTVDDLRRLM